MGTRMFVGNLPYKATDDDVRVLFAAHGTVKECKVIVDRETGRSKGFAFVDMSTEEEVQQAISQLHGYEFDGRPLNVNEARPKEERAAGTSLSFRQSPVQGYDGINRGGDRFPPREPWKDNRREPRTDRYDRPARQGQDRQDRQDRRRDGW